MKFTFDGCPHCGYVGPLRGLLRNESTCPQCKEALNRQDVTKILKGSNPFVRFTLISDHIEHGRENDIKVGEIHIVKFPAFKKIHKVFLSQIGEGDQGFVILKPIIISNESFQIISSRLPNQTTPDRCSVSWAAYGNKSDEKLEVWQEILLSSIEYESKEDYQTQLVQCQTAFEIYLDGILNSKLKKKYLMSEEIIESILRKYSILEQLAFWMKKCYGKGFSPNDGICKEWREKVYGLRNEIIHEGKSDITREDSVNAFVIVCEFIQEIEELRLHNQ